MLLQTVHNLHLKRDGIGVHSAYIPYGDSLMVVGGGYLLLGAGIITGIISTPETSNTMMAGIGCSTVTLVTCGMSYGAQKQIKHISKK